MFGGLEIKSKEDAASENSAAAAAATSSFSFLQNSTASEATPSPSVNETTEPASSSTAASSFGFLSAPAAVAAGGETDAVDSNNNNNSSVGKNNNNNGSNSGFSFLSNANTDTKEVPNTSTAASSFSFMGGAAAATSSSHGNEGDAPAAPAPAMSGFSFLSSSTATAASVDTNQQTVDNTPQPSPTPSLSFASSSPIVSSIPNHNSPIVSNNNSNDITNNTQSDLLSTANQTLPAGAGISWSAPPIQTKKKVKKKTGKTRVGVNNNNSSPMLSPVSNQTSSMHQQQQQQQQQPSPLPPPAPAVPPSRQSPPLNVKAERAHRSAEEFIREKQRSAIALAAERAVLDKKDECSNRSATSGSVGNLSANMSEWKLANDDDNGGGGNTIPSSSPKSPTDDTYRAAKAAAEEAKKIESVPSASKTTKFSLSGFFHRKQSGVVGGNAGGGSGTGGGANNEMTSYSSHGGVVGRVGGGSSTPTNSGENGLVVPSPSLPPSYPPLPPTYERGEAAATDGTVVNREEEEKQRMAAAAASKREEELRIQREKEYQMELQKQEAAAAAAAEQERLEAQRLEAIRLEEEAAKRRSPRQKMQTILTDFRSDTQSSTELVERLRSQHVQLSQDHTHALKNVKLAQQQISHAQEMQSKAVDEEDFETADELGTVIESHQREESVQLEICAKIVEAMEQIEKEKEVAVVNVAKCFGGVYERLKELEVEQEGRRKEDGTDVLDKFTKTSKRLSAETDRLNKDLKHIERDEELVADEQKELEDVIAEGTKEFEEKCVEVSEKLEIVNVRIEELKKQLMEAEAEAVTLNTELATHKTSIDNVRNKFARQLGRLEKKQKSVKESRAEWESEKSSIEKEKTAHEALVQAHSEDLLNMDMLLKDIHSELSVAKNFEDIISQQLDVVGDAADGEDHVSNLDNEVLKHEAAVDEASRNVQLAESAIASLQEEMTSIETRLPILEAEKKAAASKRDFKAAGRASKEIKDALARKEQCEAELAEVALTRREDAKEELLKAIASLDEEKSIAAEKGKELGMKQMAVLKVKIRDLTTILKDFEASNTDEVSVASVGAFVIESQIRVLVASGETLGAQYGGWDDNAAKSSGDVVEDETLHSAPTLDSCDEDADEKEITNEIIEQYASLKEEISTLEAAIDNAAEEEDYEAAAELEEKLESARAGIESLGIKFDVLENALSNRTNDETTESEQDVPNVEISKDEEEAANSIEDEKKDERASDE